MGRPQSMNGRYKSAALTLTDGIHGEAKCSNSHTSHSSSSSCDIISSTSLSGVRRNSTKLPQLRRTSSASTSSSSRGSACPVLSCPRRANGVTHTPEFAVREAETLATPSHRPPSSPLSRGARRTTLPTPHYCYRQHCPPPAGPVLVSDEARGDGACTRVQERQEASVFVVVLAEPHVVAARRRSPVPAVSQSVFVHDVLHPRAGACLHSHRSVASGAAATGRIGLVWSG